MGCELADACRRGAFSAAEGPFGAVAAGSEWVASVWTCETRFFGSMNRASWDVVSYCAGTGASIIASLLRRGPFDETAVWTAGLSRERSGSCSLRRRGGVNPA